MVFLQTFQDTAVPPTRSVDNLSVPAATAPHRKKVKIFTAIWLVKF
jgi:hypothetical protein